MNPRIMVMGVGNILLSDEGLGVHFLKELTDLPECVEVIEGGTAGLELVHLIQGVDFLIIIDAINARTQPGTLYRFSPKDISVYPEQFEVSFHQVGILEVLSMANILGETPNTLIYGVQPKNLSWGLDISSEIKEVFPRLKTLVTNDINSILTCGYFAN